MIRVALFSSFINSLSFYSRLSSLFFFSCRLVPGDVPLFRFIQTIQTFSFFSPHYFYCTVRDPEGEGWNSTLSLCLPLNSIWYEFLLKHHGNVARRVTNIVIIAHDYAYLKRKLIALIKHANGRQQSGLYRRAHNFNVVDWLDSIWWICSS